MASSVVIHPLSKLAQDFINKDYQRVIWNRKRKVDEENEVAGTSKRSRFITAKVILPNLNHYINLLLETENLNLGNLC